jgi:hypothetical protein
LFIDSSKVSSKALFPRNENKYPLVPLVHAVNMKENENMKLILEKICYEKYKWNICGGLKIIALLLRLQLGYTKYCCFLCEWDSRDRKKPFHPKIVAKTRFTYSRKEKCAK